MSLRVMVAELSFLQWWRGGIPILGLANEETVSRLSFTLPSHQCRIGQRIPWWRCDLDRLGPFGTKRPF